MNRHQTETHMSKFAVTITGDTFAELFASAAQIAAFGGQTSVQIAVTDTGGLTAAVVPAPPTPTTLAPMVSPINMAVPTPPVTPAVTDPDDQPNTNPPEFDSAGIPWDERIHAGTKGMNQDGTWKRRRNTSDVTWAHVNAELAQKTAGTAPAAPPAIPVPPQVPIPAGNVDASPVPVPSPPVIPAPPMAAPVAATIPVPPAPAADPVPPTPPAPVAAAPVTETAPPVPQAAGMHFGIFMPKISQAMKAGKFGDADLKGYLASWQLTDVGQLASDPVKAEQFYLWLKQSNLVD
jgi:hypothetical protein